MYNWDIRANREGSFLVRDLSLFYRVSALVWREEDWLINLGQDSTIGQGVEVAPGDSAGDSHLAVIGLYGLGCPQLENLDSDLGRVPM